jgi:tellurite resistance protein TerC
MPVTQELYGEKFFVKINNVLHATPLFTLLVLIEGSDLLFAIDSIPAIFAITTNLFIVYASNILAILGLRNLYFLLEKLHSTFEYVKYGIGIILIFTGIKLGISFKYHIPVGISILIIIFILTTSVLFSIIITGKKGKLH